MWDDPAVDWASYDLAVLRSPWDYPRPPGRVRRLGAAGYRGWRTRPTVVAWNTDKRYLAELATAGVPVVPTDWVATGRPLRPTRPGRMGDQAAVGAGSSTPGGTTCATRRTGYSPRLTSPGSGGGRLVMVQPYLPAVDTVRARPRCSSSAASTPTPIRKGPMLAGPGRRRNRALPEGGDHPAEADAGRVRRSLGGAGGGPRRARCCTRGSISSRAGRRAVAGRAGAHRAVAVPGALAGRGRTARRGDPEPAAPFPAQPDRPGNRCVDLLAVRASRIESGCSRWRC